MVKKSLSSLLAIIIMLFFTFTNVNASSDFQDVDKSNSHYKGINYLTKKGVINGYEDGTFKPYEPIRRAQSAVMFSKALDLPKREFMQVFSDINKDHRYADEIVSTWQAGIFKGQNGKFKDGPLTREQMATVLVKAFYLEDTGEEVDLNLDNVGSSHKENVKILAQHGITNQLDNFKPRDTVTRGQFSTFMYKSMLITPFTSYISIDAVKIGDNKYEFENGIRELEIYDEKHIMISSELGIIKSEYNLNDGYEKYIFSSLFNMLQLATGEYSIDSGSNPYLDGKLNLNYRVAYEKDLENTLFSIGYEEKYHSPTKKTIDKWIEYDGKSFIEPSDINDNRRYVFIENNLLFYKNNYGKPEVSLNDLLKHLDINTELSIGKDGELNYIEIKK